MINFGQWFRWLLTAWLAAMPVAQAADVLPIFDAHVHYSQDAWERMPPKEAIALLRKAGVTRALVSSSNDDGNQKLYAEAPDLILPSLRTYRTRADIGAAVYQCQGMDARSESLGHIHAPSVGPAHAVNRLRRGNRDEAAVNTNTLPVQFIGVRILLCYLPRF